MGTGTTADSAPAPAVQDDPGSDVDLIGVAGMCLAVLLVGSVGAVLRRRGVAALRGIDVVVRGGGWPARSRRDRDPPCLVALSIQRC